MPGTLTQNQTEAKRSLSLLDTQIQKHRERAQALEQIAMGIKREFGLADAAQQPRKASAAAPNAPRRRGRPKGPASKTTSRGRGRPKGSRNKPKQPETVMQSAEADDTPFAE